RATQGLPVRQGHDPAVPAGIPGAVGGATVPLEGDDEETVVRRPSRDNQRNLPMSDAPRAAPKADRPSRPVPAEPALRDSRKRLPIALMGGLLALVLVGVLVAYLTSRKPATPGKPATQQENDRAATGNANAGAASPSPAGAPSPTAPPATPPEAVRSNAANP